MLAVGSLLRATRTTRVGICTRSFSNLVPDNGKALVSAEWVHERVGDSHLRIFDCSSTSDAKRDPRREYRSAHIPTASFLDFAELRDGAAQLPNMLPSVDQFREVRRHVLGGTTPSDFALLSSGGTARGYPRG